MTCAASAIRTPVAPIADAEPDQGAQLVAQHRHVRRAVAVRAHRGGDARRRTARRRSRCRPSTSASLPSGAASRLDAGRRRRTAVAEQQRGDGDDEDAAGQHVEPRRAAGDHVRHGRRPAPASAVTVDDLADACASTGCRRTRRAARTPARRRRRAGRPRGRRAGVIAHELAERDEHAERDRDAAAGTTPVVRGRDDARRRSAAAAAPDHEHRAARVVDPTQREQRRSRPRSCARMSTKVGSSSSTRTDSVRAERSRRRSAVTAVVPAVSLPSAWTSASTITRVELRALAALELARRPRRPRARRGRTGSTSSSRTRRRPR